MEHRTGAAMSGALRTVALIEAARGAVVLLAGFGLLSLIHHDIQRFAERLIFHAHLNPAARYPRIFLDVAGRLTDARLLLLASGASTDALVRFIEAYGLWHGRRWAQWFAALTGCVYIPLELFELYERVTWLSLGVLVLNSAIAVLMFYCVFRKDGGEPATEV